ncbi:hypothetical protein [Aestuariivirga sp.]|uniref:hypothetical protein n=1 Tax=Aestuariivirga sp. TaxID=2650926 RepID=UPI00391A9FB8
MKIVLAIFCGLMVLFAGGCALLLMGDGAFSGSGGSVPFALIPGGIAALNVLVLVGLFGKSPPQRWAFYLLAGVDVAAALILALIWASLASQMADVIVIALPLIGALVLKAVLTFVMARRLPRGPA